ncbi:hypothetical protein QG37_03821 [Candidozyma auris]|nr:hypothetical protein QG37_03821 [[Candida] auris]
MGKVWSSNKRLLKVLLVWRGPLAAELTGGCEWGFLLKCAGGSLVERGFWKRSTTIAGVEVNGCEVVVVTMSRSCAYKNVSLREKKVEQLVSLVGFLPTQRIFFFDL